MLKLHLQELLLLGHDYVRLHHWVDVSSTLEVVLKLRHSTFNDGLCECFTLLLDNIMYFVCRLLSALVVALDIDFNLDIGGVLEHVNSLEQSSEHTFLALRLLAYLLRRAL